MHKLTLWNGCIVPRIGMGCWAIGGHFMFEGRPDGWGDVDDAQSERAIAAAFELGARLFDTADAYGTGHSERVLGRALTNRRQEAVIATKFGYCYDEHTKTLDGTDVTPGYVRRALEASLARLGTDYVDLYQIHVGELDPDSADRAAETLEGLAREGRIRAWGWSTDNAEAIAHLGQYPHFVSVQQHMNLFEPGDAALAAAEQRGLTSLVRSPLAMGLLTGKYDANTRLPSDDVRAAGHSWVRLFANGTPTREALSRLDAVRDLLRSGGRSLAQGALGWILARSPKTLPLPGFKTEQQVRDNFGAAEKGPLPASVVAEIDEVLQQDLAS